MINIDYKKLFRSIPYSYIVIGVDIPKLTVLDCTDYHLNMVGLSKEMLIGKGLFDCFPDADKSKGQTNSDVIRHSIAKVIETKQIQTQNVLRYDVYDPSTSEYIIRYWKLEYSPLFDDSGEVQAVVQSAIDVTKLVDLGLKI